MMRRLNGVTLFVLCLCLAFTIETVSILKLIDTRNGTVIPVNGGSGYDQKPRASAPVNSTLLSHDNKRWIFQGTKKTSPASKSYNDPITVSKEPIETHSPTEQYTSSLASDTNVRARREVLPVVKSYFTEYKTDKKEDSFASSCAILFFGLPRSFKLFVLPSIIENIIVPNMENNCDYYLHYHNVAFEGENRGGEPGGPIYGNDVFLLEDAIREIYDHNGIGSTGNNIPHISITNSTVQEFEQARGRLMHSYETALDESGRYLYFPYAAASWEYPHTMRNMVKQWHSIDAVWRHMEANAKRLKREYARVAMLRNDVVYVTPLDVYQLSTNERDFDNNHFVIPNWANYPINDRMVVGPYDAVKVWATERFQRIETHVRKYPIPGWGMHSEKFLNFTIVPAMIDASGHSLASSPLSSSPPSSSSGYIMDQNPNICFLRARADGSIWIEDCSESFDCDMESVVLEILSKHHKIGNSSKDQGIYCTRKSIQGIKNQDVLSCQGGASF